MLLLGLRINRFIFLLALWLHHVLLPSHGSVEKLTVTSCSWGFLVHGFEQFGISIILMCLCSLQFIELGVLLVFSIKLGWVFCLFACFGLGFFFYIVCSSSSCTCAGTLNGVPHISEAVYILSLVQIKKSLLTMFPGG